MYASGVIGVKRYTGSAWVDQVYDHNSKGFLVQHSEARYDSSYYSDWFSWSGGSSFPLTNLSNEKSGNTVTSVFTATNQNTSNDELEITQKITYVDGNSYFKIEYEIENISDETLSDLRFFHGEDTYLLGGDNGAGFWDASNTTVGVEKDDGTGTLQRMSLQGITEPYAYESRSYSYVGESVYVDGQLETDTNLPSCNGWGERPCHPIDANESTDNGYALEWRRSSISDGANWSITAYEKFGEVDISGLSVTAPVVTNCAPGDTCDMAFSVNNPGESSIEATLSVSSDLSWTTIISSPSSPVTIPGGSTQPVTVQVTVPSGTANDTTANVTLTANDGTEDASDTGALVAKDETPPTVESHNLINVSTDFSLITVEFSEEMQDMAGHSDPDDVTNPENYKLFQVGPNGSYDFIACSDGEPGDDVFLDIGPVTYNNITSIAAIIINGGVSLPAGNYRFMVCGTTSVVDLGGNPVNNGVDEVVNFDVANRANTASSLPATGFAPGQATVLPEQTLSESYTESGIWLEVPDLNIYTKIVGIPYNDNVWDVSWLGDRVGYLHGTAFPTRAGNSVLTGHSIDSGGRPGIFTNLDDLAYGDTLSIHAWDQEYVYSVRAVNRFVHPENTSALDHQDLPYLTLITCHGYDATSSSYTWRTVVQAVQVGIKIIDSNKIKNLSDKTV